MQNTEWFTYDASVRTEKKKIEIQSARLEQIVSYNNFAVRAGSFYRRIYRWMPACITSPVHQCGPVRSWNVQVSVTVFVRGVNDMKKNRFQFNWNVFESSLFHRDGVMRRISEIKQFQQFLLNNLLANQIIENANLGCFFAHSSIA